MLKISMNFKNMLSETSQIQKATYCMILFVWNRQTRQINTTRKQTGDCQRSYDKPKQYIKEQRHYFVNKDLWSQRYGFSSSHVWMWELGHQESWLLKNWCFWIMVLEKTLESPLDSKEIKLVNPKGSQPRIFIGRTDVGALLLWPPDAKSWLIGKDSYSSKDWGQEDKEVTDDEMVGWHHGLNGREFEQTLGDSAG